VTDLAAFQAALAGIAGRSFLSPASLSAATFRSLIDYAIALKSGAVRVGQPLAGKTVALVFFNPSLRTRASMTVATHQLGGLPMTLDVGQGVWGLETRDGAVMDGDKPEHIREMIPVVASYADILAVRCFPRLASYAEDVAEPVLTRIAGLSKVPVVNLESALHHPCQGLADMMTVKERLGSVKKRKLVLTWAYHPKALPLAVPQSFLQAGAQCGADLTVVAPPEFALDPRFVVDTRALAAANGGSLETTSDRDALEGADVVYAKSWSSVELYGDTTREAQARQRYKSWMLDTAALAKAPQAMFMHCLPVRRNVEVADGVLDGPQSHVLQEAENRLHAQKALLAALAGGVHV
jgi:N-acetylornithine carbamoyltransferase